MSQDRLRELILLLIEKDFTSELDYKDFIACLRALNLKHQDPNQLLSSLPLNVKLFEAKLKPLQVNWRKVTWCILLLCKNKSLL